MAENIFLLALCSLFLKSGKYILGLINEIIANLSLNGIFVVKTRPFSEFWCFQSHNTKPFQTQSIHEPWNLSTWFHFHDYDFYDYNYDYAPTEKLESAKDIKHWLRLKWLFIMCQSRQVAKQAENKVEIEAVRWLKVVQMKRLLIFIITSS